MQLHVGCDGTGTAAVMGAQSRARESSDCGGRNGPGIREQLVRGETGGGKFI